MLSKILSTFFKFWNWVFYMHSGGHVNEGSMGVFGFHLNTMLKTLNNIELMKTIKIYL